MPNSLGQVDPALMFRTRSRSPALSACSSCSRLATSRGRSSTPKRRDVASDDTSALAAVAARAALAGYLQKASPPACREFAAGGIQRPDRLDSEGQRLFRDVLQALETAYRSGRASGKPTPMASRAEILDM